MQKGIYNMTYNKTIANIGVIAALYIILTAIFSSISFGTIQCRVSDSLLFFCVKNKVFVWGCAIGCFFANLISPLGPIDAVIGTITNLIIGLVAYKLKKCKTGKEIAFSEQQIACFSRAFSCIMYL